MNEHGDRSSTTERKYIKNGEIKLMYRTLLKILNPQFNNDPNTGAIARHVIEISRKADQGDEQALKELEKLYKLAMSSLSGSLDQTGSADKTTPAETNILIAGLLAKTIPPGILRALTAYQANPKPTNPTFETWA